MSIIYHEQTKEFHLYNDSISYIIKVLRNGQMGQVYFGNSIPDKEDFSYFIETAYRPMTSYLFEGDLSYSLEHLKQEYPSYGTTDYREPAFEIIERKTGGNIPFKIAGIATDFVCVMEGFAFGSIVGAATVITAAFMGPLIQWFRKNWIKRMIERA
ncbi:glycoside hydrolase family 36 N-terminal domain-containing protein [Enterocloster clostridioformis]|uniref:glycoside hydrolase family 36 N-terminal domain-containing protein n=1 Tax=Enterocloster clostridioformis TaxID=1531 RepID=UPI0026746119|nr:glycoside hydrolase family 36 N-terminal domain-containing protein [Enterocloster clostridioformis]